MRFTTSQLWHKSKLCDYYKIKSQNYDKTLKVWAEISFLSHNYDLVTYNFDFLSHDFYLCHNHYLPIFFFFFLMWWKCNFAFKFPNNTVYFCLYLYVYLHVCVLQVCSVLESLEQEYKREEDWCGGTDKLGPNSESDHVTPMISKHLEQKEAFLKVPSVYTHALSFSSSILFILTLKIWCKFTESFFLSLKACTLARRNADVFLKYLHRNSVNMPGMLAHVKAPEQQVKSKTTSLF